MNYITAIDTATNTVVATIVSGSFPWGIGISPDGATAYATGFTSSRVTTINTATNAAGPTIPVGSTPTDIAITPNGDTAYVANQGSDNVSAIDAATNAVVATIPVGDGPLGAAITPDGSSAYISNQISGSVSVIDTATNTVAPVVGLPAASGPRGVAFTPDGSSAYVVNSGADNVTPIATAGNTVGAPIPVGSFPQSVAIVPDQGPVADFSSTPRLSGKATGFDGLASSDPDGVVAGYDWDFGDGSTLPNGGPTPTHTYTQAGTYTASLTVTDDENCSTQRVFTGQTVSCNGSSAATRSRELSISATVPREPGGCSPGPGPQMQAPPQEAQPPGGKLAKATGEAKRSMIEASLEDSKKRLKKLGCK